MTAKFIQEGSAIDYTATTAVKSGDVVMLGDIAGVATYDIEAENTGVLQLSGIFDVEKVNGAVTLGGKVYFDETAKKATTVMASNKLIGVAICAAAANDSVVRIKLN